MGLLVKNKNNYELENSIQDFFNIPITEEPEDDYSIYKDKISKLDIDIEEKADIINKISLLTYNKSASEKKKLKKEIDKFIEDYNL